MTLWKATHSDKLENVGPRSVILGSIYTEVKAESKAKFFYDDLLFCLRSLLLSLVVNRP